ncbi:hypothetical protein HII13_001905 [Brettanomyces bruxellensis]|nr:hypothetical protein HII13_001905 [Brettanomyces bruxellensis]
MSESAFIDVYMDASVIEIVTSSGSILNARAYGDVPTSLKISSFGSLKAAICDVNLVAPISKDRLSTAVKGEEKLFCELTSLKQ